MIKNSLKYTKIYHNLSENINLALDFLENHDLKSFANGKYEIKVVYKIKVANNITKRSISSNFKFFICSLSKNKLNTNENDVNKIIAKINFVGKSGIKNAKANIPNFVL